MPSLNSIGKDKIENHDKEVVFRLLKKNEKLSFGKSSKNLIVEGDNLEALKALMPHYAGQVKCIYIDPPYNTGNEGWAYNDKVNSPRIKEWLKKTIGMDDLERHDKWLCMMYPRLKLLRDLLHNNGVIFISIDDNELSNLQILMNEIFGGENFVANLIHKNNSSKNQANLVSVSTEYMLVYFKNKESARGKIWRVNKKGADDIAKMYLKLKKKGLPIIEIETEIKLMYSRPKYAHLSRWNKVDEKGVFVDADLSREGGAKDYTIKNPKTRKPCIVPDRGWGKSHEELLKLQREDLIYYGDEGTPPRMKVYIEEENNEMVPDSFMYFDNSVDTRMIKEMFGKLVFENPKPLELIKTILQMSTNKDDLILDSFAGSGTTADAVMQLNKEKKESNRRFILVEMEEKIAQNITSERVRRVAKDLGGDFEYVTLGDPLFESSGAINQKVSFEDLASYIYFTETHTNINSKKIKVNFIGEYNGQEFYLLFKDKDKNILNRASLPKIGKSKLPKIVYADKCLLDQNVLDKYGIIFKQIPYSVKTY